ncbi:uncharacterized protein LOC143445597 isoform X2 [Clavelina lepadiformis]|uniref:uncharacterized protein LOC143445597 isoform X2 n=1 Tax=Clavelina lepadiformis TaxID=159417 RepID=UPI00404317A0
MGKLNPKKLKVAELKVELEARNIPITKGLKKADLVTLLMSAIESEEEGAGEESMMSEEDPDASTIAENDSQTEDEASILIEPKQPEEDNMQEKLEQPEEITQEKPEETAAFTQESEKVAEEPEAINAAPEISELTEMEPPKEEEEPEHTESEIAQSKSVSQQEEQMETEPTHQEEPAVQNEPESAVIETPDEGFGSAPTGDEASQEEEPTAVVDKNDEEEQPKDSTADSIVDSEKAEESESSVQENGGKGEPQAQAEGKDHKEEKREESISSEGDQSSRKRRHDDDRQRRYEERYAPPPEEPEEEFDDTLVVFDKYNSDLNMKLHRDRLTGQPLTLEGFAYLWAGSRATYGVKAGKICYECKLAEEHSVRHLPSHEKNRHLVRLGWSLNHSSMLLGEEKLSFAYCGTAKAVTNKTSVDFGETFTEGDVIGCYLDLTGEENISFIFTKNGKSLGVAFAVEKSDFNDAAIFPHVLCKNTTVEMNFDKKETPFFPHPEGLEDYEYIATIPLDERVRGTVGPSTRKDCEVLMLCGLPGSGKTYYASKHANENPDKNYCILGTNALITRMQVTGLQGTPSRDILMQHASSCLTRLFQVACRKKRNFILDQTNVYSSAQRRKMRPFEGFHRKAIVIVPTDEEFKTRIEKRTKDEGKDIPDIAVYEMKANFAFPEVGDLFEEIIFSELDQEEASKLIEEYRKDAKQKGPPPEKRFRGNFDGTRPAGRGGWGFNDNRNMGIVRPPFRASGSGGGGGGGFGAFGGANRFGSQRGGFRDGDNNRRNYGGGGGGGNWNQSKGNWQQNRNFGGGRGGYQAGNRGGYGGNRSGTGGGGFNRNNNRQQQNRNYGNQQNRSNYNQNRNNQQSGRGGGNRNQSSYSYQHQAYQQQTAQIAAQVQRNQQNQSQQSSHNTQAYNPQSQQDYSQQWAQYYQQQQQQQQQQAAAAQQQQQATAAAAQYQNYYASYQQAYNSTAGKP